MLGIALPHTILTSWFDTHILIWYSHPGLILNSVHETFTCWFGPALPTWYSHPGWVLCTWLSSRAHDDIYIYWYCTHDTCMLVWGWHLRAVSAHVKFTCWLVLHTWHSHAGWYCTHDPHMLVGIAPMTLICCGRASLPTMCICVIHVYAPPPTHPHTHTHEIVTANQVEHITICPRIAACAQETICHHMSEGRWNHLGQFVLSPLPSSLVMSNWWWCHQQLMVMSLCSSNQHVNVVFGWCVCCNSLPV